LREHITYIDRISYAQKYYYNTNGQLDILTYPNNFSVKYSYTSRGELSEIRRNDNDNLIYKISARNKFHSPTQCEYGNGVATLYKYNTNGLITRIQTGNKIYTPASDTTHYDPGNEEKGTVYKVSVDSAYLNYRYGYDNKGLMVSRSESVLNLSESYQYDNLDRLTQVTPNLGAAQTFQYAGNGNIDISGAGIYSYGSNTNKPHAVAKVANAPSCSASAVTYNFFNQPTQITEGIHQLNLFYGANQQRQKAVKQKSGTIESTRYHVSKYYEREIDSAGIDKRYCYIYGDNGVVALYLSTFTKDGTNPNDTVGGGDIPYKGVSNDSIYYIHTDHLGSYCAITSPKKQVVQRNWFDPWGNYKPIIKTGKGIGLPPDEPYAEPTSYLNFALTFRGFTGHEHYPQFKIINMNGRLYDPVIGRFFSPDKYVANSSFTQDFNRYSYCRNNPLKYVDPSGQSFWDAVSTILFFPARVLTETFTWINDKINGDTRYGGYFSWGYMTNQTAPGSLTPYNPINQIPFGHPLYTPPGANWGAGTPYGSGYGLTASNDLRDDMFGAEYYWDEIGGWSLYQNENQYGVGDYYGGEAGGNSGKGFFLDETIPPGVSPTATGALAVRPGRPNYPIYGPNTRNGGKSSHYGVDYGGEVGDPVFAMYDGEVTYNGYSKDFGPYFVQTKSKINGKTYFVDYGHLKYSSLKKGTWLNAGDLVGLMGRKGQGFRDDPGAPTHVHIAVWRNVNGKRGYVQPSWQPRSYTIPWQYRLFY